MILDMSYIIAGLGNPGQEYEDTRHNVGRMFVEYLRKKEDFPEWHEDKKLKAATSEGKMGLSRHGRGKGKVLLLEPNNFMNNSGKSISPLVKNKKAAEQLVIVYDDLDLPLGSLKVSFNRGSGGHRGLDSVIKTVKTREFARIRIGISSVTPSGKVKKPSGEKAVIGFILGKFKPKEIETLKKSFKKAHEALGIIVSEKSPQLGREKAMGEIN